MMKKWIWLLFPLLALPLMAQSADTYKMPPDVYDALLYASKTGKKYSENLPAEEKALLAPAKGLVFIQFSYPYCEPCKAMISTLQNEGWMTYWKDNGVRFFKINSKNDKTKEESLSSFFKVRSFPFLLVLKDGQEVGRKTGYESSSSQAFLNEIKKLTNTYSK